MKIIIQSRYCYSCFEGRDTYLVHDWMEILVVNFVEIIVDVLVWQIAAEEDTMKFAARILRHHIMQRSIDPTIVEIIEQTLEGEAGRWTTDDALA